MIVVIISFIADKVKINMTMFTIIGINIIHIIMFIFEFDDFSVINNSVSNAFVCSSFEHSSKILEKSFSLLS